MDKLLLKEQDFGLDAAQGRNPCSPDPSGLDPLPRQAMDNVNEGFRIARGNGARIVYVA